MLHTPPQPIFTQEILPVLSPGAQLHASPLATPAPHPFRGLALASEFQACLSHQPLCTQELAL